MCYNWKNKNGPWERANAHQRPNPNNASKEREGYE